MRTLKDKKKFGWDKPIKNRHSKRGVGFDKDIRKNRRRKLGEVKDLIIHRLPINLDEYSWVINDALSSLGYKIRIWWDFFSSSYVYANKGDYINREKLTNIYDIL